VTVLPGALFATIGWIVVSLGFSFYVNNFGNYSATYGSIGGVIVLMIWLYLSAMIILIGGEVNALRNDQKRGAD
jgi:membrane protein